MRNDEILKRTEEGVKESNKILIQELIYDLENKGISPVISIDGEIKKLKLVKEIESDDFEEMLQKFGFTKSDFCLLEADSTDLNKDGSTPLQGVVVAVHKKSFKVREYKEGNGSHWVADFHRDLGNKFFSE